MIAVADVLIGIVVGERGKQARSARQTNRLAITIQVVPVFVEVVDRDQQFAGTVGQLGDDVDFLAQRVSVWENRLHVDIDWQRGIRRLRRDAVRLLECRWRSYRCGASRDAVWEARRRNGCRCGI